ncbi:hypothetical protein GALMADRAFT_1240947 [Galerina marginata CBS 339.88]|uniref:Uncharacterized protein n=1 Tax=Galerina marginata (strain CBS 339.88) TaxID=685588 RepID=A0A067TKJ8_GALM3|nr:hypothetical protein GALMADRAFT_1240947 [Galerina marginata CBS 339.88]
MIIMFYNKHRSTQLLLHTKEQQWEGGQQKGEQPQCHQTSSRTSGGDEGAGPRRGSAVHSSVGGKAVEKSKPPSSLRALFDSPPAAPLFAASSNRGWNTETNGVVRLVSSSSRVQPRCERGLQHSTSRACDWCSPFRPH